MKSSLVALAALLSLSGAAFAQEGTLSGPAYQQWVASQRMGPMSLHPGWRYARNANDCAPGAARAIWGAGDAPLAYSCYDNPN